MPFLSPIPYKIRNTHESRPMNTNEWNQQAPRKRKPRYNERLHCWMWQMAVRKLLWKVRNFLHRIAFGSLRFLGHAWGSSCLSKKSPKTFVRIIIWEWSYYKPSSTHENYRLHYTQSEAPGVHCELSCLYFFWSALPAEVVARTNWIIKNWYAWNSIGGWYPRPYRFPKSTCWIGTQIESMYSAWSL